MKKTFELRLTENSTVLARYTIEAGGFEIVSTRRALGGEYAFSPDPNLENKTQLWVMDEKGLTVALCTGAGPLTEFVEVGGD